jgi:hypothetical protein
MSNSEPLDGGNALAVSADGTVIAGYASLPSSKGAFHWTDSTGITVVGPGDEAVLSSNGSTLAGIDDSPNDGYHLFRWTTVTGLADLGRVDDGAVVSAISGDGTTIVGSAQALGGATHAFVWNAVDGVFRLGATDDTLSYADAVDSDGRVVVGAHVTAGESQSIAFRWDRQHGLVDLELGNLTSTVATGITRDGTTIVGTSDGDSWTWSEATGTRLVLARLADMGVDVSGFSSSFQVRAVSDDGTVLTGCVNDSTLATQAFIARLGN